MFVFFFFFNDTATTEIYTLSLHDALPIYDRGDRDRDQALHRAMITLKSPREIETMAAAGRIVAETLALVRRHIDRKSTRLNSSHSQISYAVFCLKKKKHMHSAFAQSLYRP